MLRRSRLVFALIFLFVPNLHSEDAVTIRQIQGLDPARGLKAGQTIRYFVHIKVEAGQVQGFGNGFRVYSPDDANWQPLTTMQMIMLSSYFDGLSDFPNGSVDGQGADSIAVCGFQIFAPGFEPGFDSDVFYIQTRVAEEQIGKTLCLDSSYVGVIEWIWATSVGGVRPSWDGPHCYEIVNCCGGNRGDVNGDNVGPNILDLTRLVDYLFRGATAPDCRAEADVNGDGFGPNIEDLSFIVDYMHRGGAPAGPCPGN